MKILTLGMVELHLAALAIVQHIKTVQIQVGNCYIVTHAHHTWHAACSECMCRRLLTIHEKQVY